jgi:outer membrane immunogenic protein
MFLRITLSSIGVSILAAGAHAADLYRVPDSVSLKDAPVYAPLLNPPLWAGFYGGVNGGYAWGNDSNVGAGVIVITESMYCDPIFNARGGFGGAQIGYNWISPWSPNLVLGVEADLQGADIGAKGYETATVSGGSSMATAENDLAWFGALRGRIGYAFDRTLVYATGGFAFGGVTDALTVTAAYGGKSASASVLDDRTAPGYTVGAGIEYALSPAWSLKLEYQYIDLADDHLSATKDLVVGRTTTTASATGNYDHSYNTVRVGLNFRLPAYSPLK